MINLWRGFRVNTGELFDYLIAELERNPGDFCTVPCKKERWGMVLCVC